MTRPRSSTWWLSATITILAIGIFLVLDVGWQINAATEELKRQREATEKAHAQEVKFYRETLISTARERDFYKGGRDMAMAWWLACQKAHARHTEAQANPECTSMWWKEQLAEGRWKAVTCDPGIAGVVYRDGEPVVRP